jgi:hypothetical protein
MNFDLQHAVDGAMSINLSGWVATINGSGVDLKGYTGAKAVVMTGKWIAPAGSVVVHLEDSPDNTTFTDVDTPYLVGSNITVSGQVNRVAGEQGYIGSKRYLRAVGTLTGQTTGQRAHYGVMIVRGPKLHGPANP